MTELRQQQKPFKPRARLLALLGDQLIRSHGIAVFELVKNAYDADASAVDVLMDHVDDPDRGCIMISDDGSGMTWDIVTNVWLEPGTDFREQQKLQAKRSPKFGRTPLGEKGVGRFAAHKLGTTVELVTRAKNAPEVVVTIDWSDFTDQKYLSDAKIKVAEREPTIFVGRKTGTVITIDNLRSKWTRGDARELHRAVTSICSPFHEPDSFVVNLDIKPNSDWLSGLLDFRSVMEFAPHRASCRVDRTSITYSYEFSPPKGMQGRIKGRKVENKTIPVAAIVDLFNLIDRDEIGDFTLDLRIMDFDPQVLEYLVTDKKGLRAFMRTNGGIRVYRDGVRVFDYGEPGNDWLSLGTRRVNMPTVRVSNNLLIGAVHLNGTSSRGLLEKTNREGFVENRCYELFKGLVFAALSQVEVERNIDKERLRKAYSSRLLKEPVLDALSELRDEIEKRRLQSELGSYVNDIEKQFRDVRDRLLTAAGPGLTMSIVIHEVEKGIGGLVKAVRSDAPKAELQRLGEHLSELVDGLTYLIRKSGRKSEKASILIDQAIFNIGFRLRAHNVKVFNGTKSTDPDFSVNCTRRMIIATLMNLLDNSIYWLTNKGAADKRILIGTTLDLPGGPAIYVVDNGPGFADPPEYLIQPFITRRPDGMGLGLHIASEIMKAHDGKLVFPERGDVDLPKGYSGALVALQFKE